MVVEQEPSDESNAVGTVKAEATVTDRQFAWFRRFLERGKGDDGASDRRRSYLIGLLGVVLINVLAIIWFGTVLSTLSTIPLTSQWLITLAFGITCAPLVISLSCVVFVPMFGCQPLVLRFAVAVGLMVPIFFMLMLAIFIGLPRGLPFDAFDAVGAVILSYSIGVALVTTTAQLAMRWSLSPIRRDDHLIPKLSVGTLMQLMFVVAVMCLFSRLLLSNGMGEIWILILVGFGAASACISFIITMGVMSENRRWTWSLVGGFWLVVAVLTAWAEYYALPTMGGSGWLAILPFAIFDGLVISLLALGVFWAQLYWLRGCGWTVVSR